jgi:hypothetical protein
MIIEGTSYPDAINYFWENQGDWQWQIQWYKRSTSDKIYQIASDLFVYTIAFILRAHNQNTLKNTLNVDNKGYEAYVSENEYHGGDHHKNQEVILILVGEGGIAGDPEYYKQLAQESGCKVFFIKYRSEEDVVQKYDALNSHSNKVKALWIRTHGYPTHMDFSCVQSVNITPLTEQEQGYEPIRQQSGIKNRLQLAEEFVKKSCAIMEEGAPIILESCGTAHPLPDGQENVAQFFARHAKGHSVYAPHLHVIGTDRPVIYSKDKGFSATFTGFTNCRYFTKGSVLARLFAIWHAFRNHREEITTKQTFK